MDLGGTLGDIVSAPLAVTNAAGTAAQDLAGGLFGPGISTPGLDPQAREAKTQLLADASTARADAATLRGVADPLLKAFQTGALTEGQQAELDLARGQGSAAIEQQAANAGISTSSFAASQRGMLSEQMLALKQGLLNNDFSQAMQAMGLSTQDLGLSGADLGRVLGEGSQEQQLGLQTQLANQSQRNQVIGEIGQFALAGALLFSGGAAPQTAGETVSQTSSYDPSASLAPNAGSGTGMFADY